MKLKIHTPVEAMKMPGLRFTALATDVEKFARHLTQYRALINTTEREEHFKQPLRTLLSDFFDPKDHYINTQYNQDLAIYLEKSPDSRIAVMFETKKPASGEMIRANRLNVKALHELVLYYFEEKLKRDNFQLKYLIASDYLEFFIFDANAFHRHFFLNSEIKKLYETKVNDGQPNTDFYPTLERLIDKLDDEISCVHFSLDKPEKLNKTERTAIYKMLSPRVLLKQRFITDRNALNRAFYDELLHILGLTEKKEGKKITIVRPELTDRNAASILELAIAKLEVKYPCNFTPDELASYGKTKDEQIFSIAFELCLTWINRILFLKLLEAQIIKFHPKEKGFAFLNIEKTGKFNKLFNLFHYVLAVRPNDRNKDYTTSFEKVPYLNSSLFDISEIERKSIDTTSLDDSIVLPYIAGTILKQQAQEEKKLDTLSYLFDFLDAFDYTSVTHAQLEISDDRLINASILGKIFEKINGYRDGSIYTPGFVTMYMSREAIRPAVVNKFNEVYGWDIESFEGLSNKLGRYSEPHKLVEFSSVIDTLHICDPAVGSGHFLVSALNELIAIKYELGILCDEFGHSFSGVEIRIEDDELIITNERNEAFHYEVINGRPNNEVQRLQRTLFHQKQTIIENCLFGVDINPNSVAICRLRLWIELLKHSYYIEKTNFTELETLPNIDINIKRGNSILSRFELRDTFASKHAVERLLQYASDIRLYRNETNKDRKNALQQSIETHRKWLSSQLPDETFDVKRRIDTKLAILAENQNILFYQRTTEEKERKVELVKRQLTTLNAELEAINRRYDKAFEWRYEFPEVLDENGNFKGFDAIIGNPPYIRQEELSQGTFKKYLRGRYQVYAATADIYVYFYELGLKVLKQNSPLCFITANKFMRSGYGRGLRTMLGGYQVQKVIDFGDMPVFDEVVTYPAIVIVLSRPSNSNDETSVLTMTEPELTPVFDKVFDEQSIVIPITALNENIWRLEHPAVLKLIEKLEGNNAKLGDVVKGKIYLGIKTGLNEAFVIPIEVRDKLVASDPNCEKLMKPIMRGSDLSRWSYRYDSSFLIQIESSQNATHPWSRLHAKIAEEVFAETYPSVYEHLSEFRDRLKKREDQGDYFWELRSCSYWEEFNTNKIIYPDIYEHQSFALDTDNYLLTNTCYFMPNAPTWLVALLNSRIIEFYYRHLSTKMRGGYLRAFTDSLKEIPIPDLLEDAKDRLTTFYTDITSAYGDPYVQGKLETQLDHYVADLFQLSNEQRDAILTGKIITQTSRIPL